MAARAIALQMDSGVQAQVSVAELSENCGIPKEQVYARVADLITGVGCSGLGKSAGFRESTPTPARASMAGSMTTSFSFHCRVQSWCGGGWKRRSAGRRGEVRPPRSRRQVHARPRPIRVRHGMEERRPGPAPVPPRPESRSRRRDRTCPEPVEGARGRPVEQRSTPFFAPRAPQKHAMGLATP